MRLSMSNKVRPGGLARFLWRTTAGLLLAVGAPAAAQQKAAAMPPSESKEYWQYTLEEGASWRLVQVNGYTEEGKFFSEPMFMIQNAEGLYNAPLPYGVREDLLQAVDSETTSLSISRRLVDEIAISEEQGYLTPALEAIAEPMEGEVLEYGAPQSGDEAPRVFGRCDDKFEKRSKSFNYSTPISKNFNIGGGFSGNVSLTGEAFANAVGEVQVRVKRYKVLGVCIPYGVEFDYARAQGSAMLNYGTTLSGTVQYTLPEEKEWPIAEPPLFGIAFSIGPVPVYIGFSLPISAGFNFNASATGSVTYNGTQGASGYFDYTCTLDNCNGYSNFYASTLQGQTVTGGVSGRIKPTVFAQMSIRGFLYEPAVAYAQIGVRPYLYGDLWGYYGANCGDANGDGHFETVDALTFDLDWQLFVNAKADTLLSREKKWTLYTGPVRHIEYWDLLGSRALEPMLIGNPSAPYNTTQTYSARMRPCWPYGDNVNYQLDWGDGSTSSLNGAPTTPASATHSWSTLGTKTLSLAAQNDAHGRRLFNKTTTRNVDVNTGAGTATHLGMTWKVRQHSGAYVNIGYDSQTDPFNGDTSPFTSLPILCLYQDGRPAPAGISFNFNNGWVGGEVRASAPVTGSVLTSQAVADGICASTFGAGWRMGEFHDAGGGWGWWAAGALSTTTRYWVRINDQYANPWD